MIHLSLPMEDYLASPAIGSSLLRKILESPAEFRAAQRKRFNDTKATLLGTAVHSMILEPDDFYKCYALQPEDWGARNKGDGYKKWSEFKAEAEHDGKTAVTWEDAELIRDISRAAHKITEITEQLVFGSTEVTAFATVHGIPLKARTDLLGTRLDANQTPSLWDLKTTSEDITDDKKLFGLITKYGYHFQAAHHMRVYNEAVNTTIARHECVDDFGWIFVSTNKAAPVIRMVQAPDKLLEWAGWDFDRACSRYHECTEMGRWPNVPHIVAELPIPDWAYLKYGVTA